MTTDGNLPASGRDPRPLCIDLFCGYGGWARGFLDAGYRVIGFDNEPKCAKRYPGEFVLADVRNLDGRRFAGARVIVASPPCQSFSTAAERGRHRYGWHGGGRDGRGVILVDAALRIREESRVPMILENVAGATKWLGPPHAKYGAFYLWGDVPIFETNAELTPKKSSVHVPWDAAERSAQKALIPYPLARALAEACLP